VPEPPCQRDAIDDYYTATKDDVLVVPYAAGLGTNDILMCSGPGYTIDNLTDPPNGTVVKTPNNFGAFEYTPDPGFTGTDSFTYTLFQGSEVADQATAHITVTESCSVVAFSDVYYTAFETPVTEQAPGFLTNDTVECQPVTASVSIVPTDGSVTAGPDGAFVYTPNPGFYKTDEFTYEIRDPNQLLMATSVVTVVVDEPPCIAFDDSYSTTVDTPLNVGAPGVLANDSVCPDADSVQVAQQPAFGTVSLQSDGSFAYVPDPGFVGQDSFTYDLEGLDIVTFTTVVLATATVLIDVTEPQATTTTVPLDTTTTTAVPPDTTSPPGTTTTTGPSSDTTTTGPATPPTTPGPGPETPPPTSPEAGFRIATFNASLNRAAEGDLVTDLSSPDDQQAANVAAILQHTRPDVVLLNEFDYVEGGAAVELFRTNYLLLSQNGAQPIDYPHYFIAPSNTGVPSGFDLDNDGTVGGANDALGFGDFPGQYGMVVLSRYPIVADEVRTFQNLLWASVPGARLPDDPATAEPADWYSPDELAVLSLSSKSHWDLPIDVDGRTVHVLAAHPTPPVFDGPEDRNGMRNADEIGFWADYIAGVDNSWIVDDSGASGGLAVDAEFVILGDLNSDPHDGDSLAGATDQVLALDRVQDAQPTSDGAALATLTQRRINDSHNGDAALDTADFADDAPGNLRVDYVVPSDDFTVVDAGVFWPPANADLGRLVTTEPLASSDHRLVWVDLT
jgi:Endonuclease/Exonuclease/phosphatase family/Bacterial Ig domain